MAAETWQMSDPRRPHPDHVILDDDSAQVTEAAAYQLGIYRSPMNHGDAALRLHVLATLIAQANALLADARDQDHPWSDIAQQLGLTADTARRRYSRHHRTRSPRIDLD